MTTPLFVGLDAGGTKTAVLAHAGGAPQRFVGPGAHALRDGADGAAETLAALVGQAREAFGGAEIGGVAVGLAGAGRAPEQAAVAAALRGRLGGARVAVTHDADVALEAAWGSESGAVLLVGTGSLVYARTLDGATLRAGGWGLALGDDGSGAALGRHALRAILAAHDGGPPTALADLAAEAGLGTPEAVLDAVYNDGRPLAGFAPLLLAAAAADDWVATSLLARETNALAQQTGWLATRAAETVAHRIATCGGLTAEPVYQAALDAALARHLPGWTVRRSDAEPAQGALAMAERLAGQTAA
jgi:glucosamine kinase